MIEKPIIFTLIKVVRVLKILSVFESGLCVSYTTKADHSAHTLTNLYQQLVSLS